MSVRTGTKPFNIESDKMYQAVFENTGTAMAIIEEDLIISLANTRFVSLAGYSQEEIQGKKKWTEFVAPQNLEMIIQQHNHRRKNPASALTEYEFAFIDRSGQILDMVLTVNIIPGTTRSIASLIDITERKKTELALQESEIQLANAMELADLVQWELDIASGMFTFDDRFYSLYATSSDKEGGNLMAAETYVREFVHPDDGPWIADRVQKALAGLLDEFPPLEHRIVHRDGKIRHIVVRFSVLRNSDGNIVKVFGANQDITERKLEEKALMESEARLKSLIDNLPAEIWAMDTDLHYELQNSISIMNHGILIGKHPAELDLPLDTITMWLDQDLRVMQGETIQGEYSREMGGETRHYKNLLAPVIAEDRVLGIVGAAVDVTDQKRIEESLKLANRKLNLLSSITRHDINNKLMALEAYIAMSHEAINDPSALKRYFTIEQEIADIIAHQIAFTKIYEEMGVHAPTWQKIHTTIGNVVTMLPVGNLFINLVDSALEVFADSLLEKVFYNLIDNALRYGGEKMNSIQVSTRLDAGNLIITVKDDGNGIDGDEKEMLFTKGFGKNSGLGLFLSREILSITGIMITENGVPGKGAQFEITVPGGIYRCFNPAP